MEKKDLHTQVSNNIGGLNKHQLSSTDNIEERELGVTKGYSEKGAFH